MFRSARGSSDARGEGLPRRLEATLAEDLLGGGVSAVERARLPSAPWPSTASAVARGYGQTTERDLTFFVLNMITINPECHRQPHIHAILDDAALTPADRREKLLGDVSEEEWQEAAKMTRRRSVLVAGASRGSEGGGTTMGNASDQAALNNASSGWWRTPRPRRPSRART